MLFSLSNIESVSALNSSRQSYYPSVPTAQTISGRVVAADTNLPLEGFQVRIYRGEVQIGGALTGSDGNFQTGNLPVADNYRIFVGLPDFRFLGTNVPYLRESYRNVYLTNGTNLKDAGVYQLTENQNLNLGDIGLQPGAAIKGIVKIDGVEVSSGVEAKLFDSLDDPFEALITWQGNYPYEIVGLAPGTYYLQVTADDFSAVYNQKFWFEEATPIQITGAETITINFDFYSSDISYIEGTIFGDDTGNPLPNMLVSTEPLSKQEYTDSSGYFRVPIYKPGDYALRIGGSSGYLQEFYQNQNNLDSATKITVGSGMTETITASLQPAGQLMGTVTRNALAVTSNEAYAYLVRQSEVDGPGKGFESRVSIGTNSSGEFLFDTLEPDNYYLYVELLKEFQKDEGFQYEYYPDGQVISDAQPIQIVSGQITQINIDLGPEYLISGFIVDLNNPIANANVTLYHANSCASPRQLFSMSSAVDGSFQFEKLKSGSYEIKVEKAGYAPLTYPITIVDANQENIDLALQKGSTISGSVTDLASGQPLENIGISLLIENPLGQVSHFGIYGSTGSNGEYQLVDVPPGEYKVQFSGGVGSLYASQYFGGVAAPGASQSIMVQSGTDVIDIDAALQPGGEIEGTVIDSFFKNERKAQVRLLSESGDLIESMTTSYNPGSKFLFDYLLPGKYIVEVLPEPPHIRQFSGGTFNFTNAVPLTVNAGEVTRADFDVQAGGSASFSTYMLDNDTSINSTSHADLYDVFGRFLMTLPWGNDTLEMTTGLPSGQYFVRFRQGYAENEQFPQFSCQQFHTSAGFYYEDSQNFAGATPITIPEEGNAYYQVLRELGVGEAPPPTPTIGQNLYLPMIRR
ncbi:MAG: carboxypeptidase regulatory-like domain-containing protein [Ardenticatenaceae bacterium]|nr:carboxypeptidase regulatory-like domain-containing protein [Ardenticatenaceae bacterium]